MSSLLRATFDTNVFVSALLSRNPNSPTRELLARFAAGEFELIVSDALVDELIATLLKRKVEPSDISNLIWQLRLLARWVEVPVERIERLVVDPDDDMILACALVGQVEYLVTYDPHLASLGPEFRGLRIVGALPFLWIVRG